MSRLDTDQADRDAIADRRHERDVHREPRLHRHPRCVQPVARGLFQARVIDSVNAAQAEHSYTMRLTCPTCRGPMFAPRDSDRERVVCNTCQAICITRRTVDGVDLRIHEEPANDEAK